MTDKPKRKTLTLNFGKKEEKEEKEEKPTDTLPERKPTAEKEPKAKKKRKFKRKEKVKVEKKGPTPAKSKEQRDKEVLGVIATLCEKFPNCFHQTDHKPLKIGIIDDLFEALPREDFTKKALRRALEFYTYRMRYLKALQAQEHRYNLKGDVSGGVTPKQKEMALVRLEEMKARQAQKAEEKKQQSSDVKSDEPKGEISREWQA